LKSVPDILIFNRRAIIPESGLRMPTGFAGDLAPGLTRLWQELILLPKSNCQLIE
jgi:hypothetical protein